MVLPWTTRKARARERRPLNDTARLTHNTTWWGRLWGNNKAGVPAKELEPQSGGRAARHEAQPGDERPAAAMLTHRRRESSVLIVRPGARTNHAATRQRGFCGVLSCDCVCERNVYMNATLQASCRVRVCVRAVYTHTYTHTLAHMCMTHPHVGHTWV